jgi:hypothetical protein
LSVTKDVFHVKEKQGRRGCGDYVAFLNLSIDVGQLLVNLWIDEVPKLIQKFAKMDAD